MESIDFNFIPKGVDIRSGDETIRLGDFRSDLSYLRGAIDARIGTTREKIAFLSYLRRKSADIEFGVAMADVGTFYRNALKPFLDGVFLADSDRVSNRMARELIHWFIKGRPGIPNGGVRTISDALASGLDIEFNTQVLSLSTNEVITERGRETADAVVLATDPVTAARMLGIQEPQMNGSQTWYFKLPDGLVTSSHLRVGGTGPIVNTVALSNIASSYAPVGQTLVSATNLGSAREADIRLHLSYLWEQSTKDWELINYYSIPNSLPLHSPKKPLLEPAFNERGIYLAGDWRGTPSQQGALLSGRVTAQAVISRL